MCVTSIIISYLTEFLNMSFLQLSDMYSQSEPSEILPHVYLGDVSHSAQRALLEELGITALLNVSSSCHNHFQTSYTYKNVTVSDNMDADLISWFPELIDFIGGWHVDLLVCRDCHAMRTFNLVTPTRKQSHGKADRP